MAPRYRKGGGKLPSVKDESSSLKIKIRGKDNAPLGMDELREGLIDAARKMQEYQSGYRAKFATIYLTVVDENGQPVRINDANELTIYPYRSAADEHGV
ncbi:hypothetical protein LB533_25770 [Mesorhizobium sp. BR1-1-13]|uniref:hypothetical protein n=1 Tax=Mesorhizobium sp. BR1-1-13 TaxID=2876656 RepID=UPI001CD0BDC2|nr:hypothetical protein [Mesorhizobium sp. BR1-1-13]MBZ9944507.1 hypothetical protein [Mesorhizobium sp. BR1-1-13]